MGKGANDCCSYVQIAGIFNGDVGKRQVAGFQREGILRDNQQVSGLYHQTGSTRFRID